MIDPRVIQALRNRQQPGQMPQGAGMAAGGASPVQPQQMAVTPPQQPQAAGGMDPNSGANPLMSKLGQVLAKRASMGKPDYSQFSGLGGQVGPMGSSGLQQQKPGAGMAGTVGGLAGGALGTAVGGPVGGAVGGFLGNAAGNALGGSNLWGNLSNGIKSLFRI